MNGPEAYRHAEHLADEAYKRLSQGDEEGAKAWAAVAQVYATLAQAAATALGEEDRTGRRAWRAATGAGPAFPPR
jgi:hypothetical protein